MKSEEGRNLSDKTVDPRGFGKKVVEEYRDGKRAEGRIVENSVGECRKCRNVK